MTTATTTTVTTTATMTGTTRSGPGTGPAPTTLYTTVPSPVGDLLLVGTADDGTGRGLALTALSVPGQRGRAVAAVRPEWRRAPAEFAAAAAQLDAYFGGELTEFDLRTAPAGTVFRQRVWAALDTVPAGSTTTYRELAAAVGSPAAVRAVGGAVGANPLLIVRPCHRVIGSDGTLTGYAGGLDRKRRLLTLEGALPPGPPVRETPPSGGVPRQGVTG